MIIQANMAYRKYWTKYAKYKGSTSTYTLFTARLDSDHVYKRLVDDFINLLQTDEQRQRELERCLNYV